MAPQNAIPRDGTHTISFCLTGGGVFQNGPADGQPPTGQAPTAVQPQLFICKWVSAQRPGAPGGRHLFGRGLRFPPASWQVQFPGAGVNAGQREHVIAITLGGVSSNLGSNGQTIQVWFATK